MSARGEVYEAQDGWRWRIVAANGEIVATGEAHTRRQDAERALEDVKELVNDLGEPAES